MLCLTAAVLVKRTFHSMAGNLCVLYRDVHRASYGSGASLTEAGAAGISGMAGSSALHLDIIFAAASVLIVKTAGHGTVQFRHFTSTSDFIFRAVFSARDSMCRYCFLIPFSDASRFLRKGRTDRTPPWEASSQNTEEYICLLLPISYGTESLRLR